MKNITVVLPDKIADELQTFSAEDINSSLEQAGAFQDLSERQDRADMRKTLLWFLLPACGVVLTVSLFLIVCKAVGWSSLPDTAIDALIGSVAVEFVGMLWSVVRYLFPQPNPKGENTPVKS
jgi:hypothetical protein